MAQSTFRVNIGSSTFPLLSKNFGQSVLLAGHDQNSVTAINSPKDLDKNVGVPQLIYAQNVMPTEEGFTTVGFQQLALSTTATTDFVDVFEMREGAQKVYVGYTVGGEFYGLASPFTTWHKLSISAASKSGKQMTAAAVNGVTYLCIANTGIYKYNFVTEELEAVSVSGLTMSEVQGVVSASGYLIAWSALSIARSAILDPTDFVPSLITGAGGGSIEQLKGEITLCVAASSGFFIFSAQNAVFAQYSGNARYPFNYREVANAGGVESAAQTVSHTNAASLYAYTSAGLQTISTTSAKVLLPDVTDFLSGNIMEDYDFSSKSVTAIKSTLPLKRKLTLIASRYLMISYGKDTLTHALVYDLAMERLGKLRLQHTTVFEFTELGSDNFDVPKRSMAIVQADGAIWVPKYNDVEAVTDAVMLFGKYQLARGHLTALHSLELENVAENAALSVTAITSYDGKNAFEKLAGTPYTGNSGTHRKYFWAVVARNITFAITGPINLNYMAITVSDGGRI